LMCRRHELSKEEERDALLSVKPRYSRYIGL